MSTEYAASLSQFQFGDMLVEYLLATESQTIGFRMIPFSMADSLATRREFLQTHEALLGTQVLAPDARLASRTAGSGQIDGRRGKRRI